VQRIDVGEHIYSMPLVDDVSGDGFLDLVVGTMNGHVLMFETSVPYHKLNTWGSFPNGRLNGFTHGQMGISVSDFERDRLKQLELKGLEKLLIEFTIFDSRPQLVTDEASSLVGKKKYSVSITRGLNRLNPLYRAEFDAPGTYMAEVFLPPPQTVQLLLTMTNDHGQHFEDVVVVSLSTRFYVWLKYLVISPIVVFSVPLLVKFFVNRPISRST
jgi:hypothetical protein